MAEAAKDQAMCPMAMVRAHAGFPSPADEYAEPPLNLHDLVVVNPQATFFVRVVGQSMQGAGIAAGDVIVVDRSLPVLPNAIVVARVHDGLVLKRVQREQGALVLHADPPVLPPLEVAAQGDIEIWGVVTHCIHRL